MFAQSMRLRSVFRWMLILVAAGLLLVACDGGQGAADDDGQPAESPPDAALAARDALAAELGLDPESVSIESYEQAEWTDSCLGLGGPAESCLAAMYPGWQVMLLAEGQTYEVRTDESAEIIRINQ